MNLQMNAGDPKEWARRIIRRHNQGEQVRPICLRFACEALRLPIPKGRDLVNLNREQATA